MVRQSTMKMLVCLLLLQLVQADVQRVYEAPVKVDDWIVQDGKVVGLLGEKCFYLKTAGGFEQLIRHEDLSSVHLSPNGEYMVAAIHEPMADVRQDLLHTEFIVYDRKGRIQYRAHMDIRADEKRFQPAVSNTGDLAVVDPLYLYLRLYHLGDIISEGQLYKLEGNRSLERRIRLWWMGSELRVLVERPGLDGHAPDQVLMLRVDGSGVQKRVQELPFTYLSDVADTPEVSYVSGYDYDPAKRLFKPQIIALDLKGHILWNHAHFGHELKLSPNQRYLAALRGEAEVAVFDLHLERWKRFSHGFTNDNLMGITVLDDGEPYALVMDKSFLVARKPGSVIIFRGGEGEVAKLTMDARYPAQLQLHSNGGQVFVGTRFEWLEVTR